MEEKVIIKGTIKQNVLFKLLLAIGLALILIGLILCAVRLENGTIYKSFYRMRMPYKRAGFNYFDLLFCGITFELEVAVGLFIYFGVVVVLLSLIANFMMSKCEITITDKRVIGKANFGKRVDLPLDHISAVGQGVFSNIAVATSSGHVRFWFVDNRNEVFDELSKLICNSQIQKSDAKSSESVVTQPLSSADEIIKFKELLDMGVITQEEFNAKKKQLLDL